MNLKRDSPYNTLGVCNLFTLCFDVVRCTFLYKDIMMFLLTRRFYKLYYFEQFWNFLYLLGSYNFGKPVFMARKCDEFCVL